MTIKDLKKFFNDQLGKIDENKKVKLLFLSTAIKDNEDLDYMSFYECLDAVEIIFDKGMKREEV